MAVVEKVVVGGVAEEDIRYNIEDNGRVDKKPILSGLPLRKIAKPIIPPKNSTKSTIGYVISSTVVVISSPKLKAGKIKRTENSPARSSVINAEAANILLESTFLKIPT